MLLILPFFAFGQVDLISKNGSDYIYRNDVYKSNELAELYMQSQNALDLYKSGRKYRTVGRTIGYAGLALIVTGLVGLATDQKDFMLFDGGAIGIGLLLELIAIAPIIKGSYNLNKALKTFNYEMIERHGYQSDTSLSINVTGNRVGLIMTF